LALSGGNNNNNNHDNTNDVIDMPVIDMDIKTIKFMAFEFFPNDIMQFFMKNEQNKK
jgi:hypothetical protein